MSYAVDVVARPSVLYVSSSVALCPLPRVSLALRNLSSASRPSRFASCHVSLASCALLCVLCSGCRQLRQWKGERPDETETPKDAHAAAKKGFAFYQASQIVLEC